jgi:lipopolysaccharide transport system permease protein/teichoic acid transport system permease protein
MARRDLRERHVGTVGGALWSLLQPLLLVATYWFVFSQGFKVSLVSAVPFILYFVVGLAPWLMFAEALGTSVGSVVANGHLIRKLVFPSEILPVVHIATAAVVHAAMLAIVLVVVVLHGYVPTWHLLQLPYYTLAALTLALGLGWVLAAVNVFYRDVGQITQAALNVLFWLTPVVWPLDLLPAAARPYLMLNPMFYVVEGYRDSLLNGVPLWERGWQALAFWSVSLPLLAVGAILFRRLKPDFAEVV